MWGEDAPPPMFDIPLKVVCLFSMATHLQTRDTGVMLICFSCRSETSGTKARFSAAQVRDVYKVFTQTLCLTSGWEVLQLWCSFQVVWRVPERERESGRQSDHWSNVTHIIVPWMCRTFYCNISLSLAPTPQLPLPSPEHSLAAGCGCSGGTSPDKAEKGSTAVLSL